MSTGAQGGESTEGDEEMEDNEEMEEDSTSNVTMVTVVGTFMAGTADATVTQVRHSTKRYHTTENMSEDLFK